MKLGSVPWASPGHPLQPLTLTWLSARLSAVPPFPAQTETHVLALPVGALEADPMNRLVPHLVAGVGCPGTGDKLLVPAEVSPALPAADTVRSGPAYRSLLLACSFSS